MKKALMITILLLLPATAWAAPEVKVSITAEKVVQTEKNGKSVEQRLPADDVQPGDILVYTLSYENRGNEAATGVVLNDPIPEGTVYIVGSAFGPGADISFSIDGGKSFKQPGMLTYEAITNGKSEKRKATPEQYSHIRWTVEKIAPGGSGTAGFRVRVK